MSFYVDPSGLSPLQYLAKLKTAIGDEFQYRILGKNDTLFQQLMRALPKERFEAVRIARTGSAIIVQQHGESTAPHSKKLTAEAQGRFLYKAAREVYDARQAAEPKKLATALSALSKELETAVNNYVAAGNESPEEQRDRAFETNARLIHDKLQLVATTLKPRLKAIQQYYNTNLVNAEKALANAKAALDGFTPGAPAAPLTVPPDDSGSTVDITV